MKWPPVSVDMTRSGSVSHQSIGEAGLHFARGGQALAELGAEGAKFFDPGDDAVLFGEGRYWKRALTQLSHIYRSKIGCLFGSGCEV